MKEISLKPIGFISTPFGDKFGIPRQSHALSAAKGYIHFSSDINPQNACRQLEQFSHLWLSFVFHENIDAGFKDTVRPPRLGGNEKVGVFASRSTFRPNPIGLSLVKNIGLNEHNQLVVNGVDLVDKTPILDIKPYIAYADNPYPQKMNGAAIHSVVSGYAEEKPNTISVSIEESLEQTISHIEESVPEFSTLLVNVLSQDPRPAYKKGKPDTKLYHIRLYNHDISWRVIDDTVSVLKIKNIGNS